jgi:multidrug efflux pump
MKITDLSIKYRTSILVLTVLLALGGLLAYLAIPKESSPSIEVPNIVVTTIYPGASPDDVESLITQPIEEEIQGVTGIKEIRSTSTEGVSSIIIEFNPDVAMDDAYQKVRDRVGIARPELPSDVEEPIVSEIDISEFPIMTINLAADYSLTRLKEVGEDLQDRLETIPSVLEVDLVGGLEQEVQINVDLNALQGYNLDFEDVIATIRQENANIPGGSVDVDRLNYLVRVDGQFKSVSEVEDLVIDAPGGNPIYVRDVANVVFGYKDRASYARLQVLKVEDEEGNLVTLPEEQARTLQVISLNVKKRAGENIIETAAAVDEALAGFTFPAGTRVEVTGDQSDDVAMMVRDLENNIISGLLFVVVVLLFFMGVRNATLVGIAIPLSMFIAFIVFSAMGQTLNFIILFSLIIALGMLVDNAIVIVENIYRYYEEGHSRWEAARLGTGEVAMPVVASTATTVAAFVPMLFWPGIIGEFMSYMPLTLIITLICSLFVALVVNPVITGIYVRLEKEPAKPMSKNAKVAAAAVILLLGLMIGFANWKTLVVLVVGVPLLYFLHTRFFKHVAERFATVTFPNFVARYRTFLTWMLQRDYTAKRALLRNTFTLGALTVGIVLGILGGAIAAVSGMTAAMILLIPAGILAVAGILGIFVHTFESVYLGGRGSVKAGLIFGAVMAVILGIMYLSPTEVSIGEILKLLILPGLIVAVGALGMMLNRNGRKYLILTDNRARLLTATLGGLFAIIFMFVLAPTGVAFFPETDPNQIRVTADARLGTNIEASNQIANAVQERISALLNEYPDSEENVKNVLVNVGVGGDAMFGGGAASPEVSSVTINMADYEDRAEPSSQTMTNLREELQGIPGAKLEFAQDAQGPPVGAPVNIEISGEDFDRIVQIAQDVRQRLTEASESGAIPGLVDVADDLNTGRPELQVRIDRERAAQYGLNTSQIATTIRSAINGTEAGKYRDGEDEYDITVRLAEADRQSLESLNNLTIINDGQQIPLVAVADFQTGGGLGSVTRLDLQRVATVSADAAPGYNAQAVLVQVQQYLADYQVPAGYTMTYTGENEEMDAAFGFLTQALLIGVALIFLIMVAQFNSVSAPFIIMIGVGLSMIGVLLGLILSRTPFGLFTFIGIISLAGIVVNNGIVLIDYTMQLRERGRAKRDAIVEAGATRLRPVILTALTTVIGLIPLTFGINIDFVGLLTDFNPNFQIGSPNTQFWGPMGTSIIAGLSFGTFLTLVIVPIMYSTFDSVSDRLSVLFASGKRTVPGALVHAGNGNGYGNGHGTPAAKEWEAETDVQR